MKHFAIESEWIKKIRNGNADAFESMFVAYYSKLCQSALFIVKDTNIAEDIVHDIFLKIWKNRKQWNPTISLKSYLYKAVRNKAFDHQKHKSIQVSNFSKIAALYTPVKTPHDYLHEREFLGAVDKAIAELPERCQHIFIMNRFEGLKYSEIADILDISVKTVETHIGRALKFLRKRLISFLLVLTL